MAHALETKILDLSVWAESKLGNLELAEYLKVLATKASNYNPDNDQLNRIRSVVAQPVAEHQERLCSVEGYVSIAVDVRPDWRTAQSQKFFQASLVMDSLPRPANPKGQPGLIIQPSAS